MKALTIDQALSDPRLLGAGLGDPATTWRTWLITLKAAFGLPLDDSEREVFAQVAGGRAAPLRRVRELWAIIGRRGGKSRMAAALAVFFACFLPRGWAAGEQPMVLVLAASQAQAKVVFGYCLGFLQSSPVLSKEIAEATRNEIRLKSGVVIAIHSNSFRTVRGRSLLAAIFDEVSFWRDETSSQPDSEVYSAVLPSLATTDGVLVGISTPYRKVGLLHAKHREYFGKDDADVLVISGGTKLFNPGISDAVIAAQRSADPTAAASEWDAEFRTDISGFVDREAVEACVSLDLRERAPMSSARYYAFVDPSGGSADSMTLAVGHREGDVVLVDALRERKPPFSPEDVVSESAELLKSYRVTSISGDRYAGEWPKERFRDHGISYEPAQKPKSDLYRDLLPAINSRKIDLLDHPRLLTQLVGLERRTARGGRDSIDHAPGAHDDLANAVAGLCGCTRLKYAYDSSMSWVS